MKKFSIIFIFLLAAGNISAQWTTYPSPGSPNGPDITQMIIEKNMMRDRLKKKNSARGKTSRTRAKTKPRKVPNKSAKSNSVSSNQTVSPNNSNVSKNPVWSSMYIRRDTYQDFHLDDSEGYRADVIFIPVSGGESITNKGKFSYYDSNFRVIGVPEGVYTVKAVVTYRGKTHQTLIGSRSGSSDDPCGGDFASEIKVVMKPGVNEYNEKIIESEPGNLYLRVIE